MRHLIISETNKMINTFTTIIKTQFLVLIGLIATFFAPVIPFVITTFCFILFDTIMGFMKVKYTKETCNSNRFKRGFIPKVVIYTLVLFMVFTADKTITSEAVKHYTQFDYVITKIVALILIFIESWSIDENFEAIFGVSIIAKFKQFLNYIKSIFRKFLDNESK
jgi:hypothetical protein